MGAPGDETVQTSTPSSGSGPSRPAVVREGTRLGRYTIGRLLGRGGVGAVYEAQDTELERRVAIKVLREDRDHPTATLRREAQALARLVHQNVIMVYDVGVQDEEVFLVMQLIEGMSIDAWIAKHHPDPAQILAMYEQAGQGLAAAHAVGLVHCDFKPGNVLVDATGVVRVGDFGLARTTRSRSLAPAAELTPMSTMTTVAGTPAYMAPEQFDGVVTPASDQFAFCVALWECLAGERPFADSTTPALELESRGARRPLPRGARIPRHVMAALERGLARDPSDRFPSMADLLAALRPPSRVGLIAASAAVLGIAAGGVVAYAVFARSATAEWNAADVAHSQTLTAYGSTACAYALTFDPSGSHIVFDRTEGDSVELFELTPTGGSPQRLLSAPGVWMWRAQPGRHANEVIHLAHDQVDPTRSYVAFLDLETGRSTRVLDGMEWDAAVIGDTVYYSPQRAGGIRTVREGADRPFLSPPTQDSYYQLAASPRGDRIALSKRHAQGDDQQPCVADLATRAVTCFDAKTMSRPVFSSDGEALYFGGLDGIVRHELASGREVLIAPGVYTESLAISPNGDALVYSTCYAHTKLQQVIGEKVLLSSDRVESATESATGLLAWVELQRGTRVLMVRTADGHDRQITTDANGDVSMPAFSPDGNRIVFVAGGTHPGLRIADVNDVGVIKQVTADGRDRAPVWTSANVIAFTRGDENENEQAFATTPDGTTPRLIASSSRAVYGHRGSELLVAGPDAMFWLDPATGVERQGPPRPPGQLLAASVSPSGAWVAYQMSPTGAEVWRVHENDPPEHLRTMQAGEYADSLLVRDSGEVLAIIGRYHGDLVRVPARPGTRF